MEQIIILLLIGAFGGLVRSILGYETQSDIGEPFNIRKTLKSVVRASLAGTMAVMGIATATGLTITTATYLTAFFLAIGTDVLIKEGYTIVKG